MTKFGNGCRPLRVSVVIPCYNEAQRLDTAAFRGYLNEENAARVIFVDDGSTDDTFSLLETLCCAANRTSEVLKLPHNFGKAEAVRVGVNHGLTHFAPEVVGYWDADLATPLTAIPSLLSILENRENIEMVFGSRVKLLGRLMERRASRHYLGRVFATVVSSMLHLPIYDTQCGAKLFRASEQTRQVFARPFLSKWVFDVEIIARYLNLNNNDPRRLSEMIYEYPLECWTDMAGSKVRPRDFLAAMVDVAKIRSRYLRHLRA